jgi:hypothetical protein
MRHRLSRPGTSLLFILPLAITVGAATGIWYGVPFIVILVSLVFAALAWYGYMTVPFEFETSPEGFISFRSPYRTLTIPISDIIEIDARRWNRGFVFLRYAHGKITLFRKTPGMRDLIDSIQRRNPSAILRGGL